MRSATSYFNKTLFRHDLAQYWPLWFVYTAVWLLVLPISLLTRLAQERHVPAELEIARSVLSGALWEGIGFGALFSLLFAMAMFSYLSSPRATLGLHAMPLRREALFVTNFLAGLFCLLSTLVLTFALTGAVMARYGWWNFPTLSRAFAASALLVLFAYPFAVLCMVCTGQILAAPVFYGVGNFLVVGMELLVCDFAGNFLYGHACGPYASLRAFSPLYNLVTRVHVETLLGAGREADAVQIGWRLEGMKWFVIYAVVGVVIAAIALLLHRVRRSELTGSTIAFTPLVPVFKYGVALCSAMALGQLAYYLLFGQHLSSDEYSLPGTVLCMAIFGLLGFYAAEMFVRKSVRVFRRSWKGALGVVLALSALGVTMSFDLTGYERRVPAAGEVRDVYVSFHGSGFNSAEEADIARVIAAHEAIVRHKDENIAAQHGGMPYDGEMVYFFVNYTLSNGTLLSRRYDNVPIRRADLETPGTVTRALNEIYTSRAAIGDRFFGGISGELYETYRDTLRFTGGYCEYYTGSSANRDCTITSTDAQALYYAVLHDIERACAQPQNLFERGNDHYIAHIELYVAYTNEDGKRCDGASYIPVRESMRETAAVLENIYAHADFSGMLSSTETPEVSTAAESVIGGADGPSAVLITP